MLQWVPIGATVRRWRTVAVCNSACNYQQDSRKEKKCKSRSLQLAVSHASSYALTITDWAIVNPIKYCAEAAGGCERQTYLIALHSKLQAPNFQHPNRDLGCMHIICAYHSSWTLQLCKFSAICVLEGPAHSLIDLMACPSQKAYTHTDVTLMLHPLKECSIPGN